MKWIFAVILSVLPLFAAAQDMPAALAAQVERNPQKYLDDFAVIVAGFGTDGAIDRSGLQNVVSMARAEVRAMALRRLLGADLNGDGAVSGEEMRIKAAASASAARGRLILYFGKADMNGDDHVGAAEMQTYANLIAQQKFSDQKAQNVYAVLGFDRNGDGRLTLDEVKTAITLALARKTTGEVEKRL